MQCSGMRAAAQQAIELELVLSAGVDQPAACQPAAAAAIIPARRLLHPHGDGEPLEVERGKNLVEQLRAREENQTVGEGSHVHEGRPGGGRRSSVGSHGCARLRLSTRRRRCHCGSGRNIGENGVGRWSGGPIWPSGIKVRQRNMCGTGTGSGIGSCDQRLGVESQTAALFRPAPLADVEDARQTTEGRLARDRVAVSAKRERKTKESKKSKTAAAMHIHPSANCSGQNAAVHRQGERCASNEH